MLQVRQSKITSSYLKKGIFLFLITVCVVVLITEYIATVANGAYTQYWGAGVPTVISNGASHTCSVAGGAAYCWGSNSGNQLGNTAAGSLSTVPFAVNATGVLSGKTVTDVATSNTHSCAVASSLAYCWGNNASGQLGTNNTTASSSPIAVTATGVLSGKTVTDIASGPNSQASCVVASSAAYCWGNNAGGQLGNNSTSQSLVPVAVNATGVLAGKTVTKISTDYQTSCAIASGAAYCWGNNSTGQLGNNSTSQSLVPVAVDTAGVLSGKTVTDISVSQFNVCVVASGAAYCWGTNGSGQLGNNSTTQSLVPVAVNTAGVLSGKTVTKISTSSNYTCAVASSATYCWGDNTNGRLGDSTTTPSLVPVAVDTSGVLAGKTVTEVATGNSHTCVIASSLVFCWGDNFQGKLGNGSATASLIPVIIHEYITIANAPYRFFANANNIQPGAPLGTINQAGALGASGDAFRIRTGVMNSLTITSSMVQAGNAHACTLASAKVYCWGANTNGPLGDNSTNTSLRPVPVTATGVLAGKSVTDITAGANHTCAVADGAAYCWGSNLNGRLGNSSTTQSLVPVAVTTSGVLSGKTVTDIAAGSSHTCAVADGAAYCWGLNTNGRLGDNSTTQRTSPVAVNVAGELAGKTVTAITAGNNHSCAIADSAIYCWGLNTNGQLGNNSTTQALVPVAVNVSGVLSGKTVTKASGGGSHTCVVASTLAYCWGLNSSNQLGDNTITQSTVPVAVNTAGVLSGKVVSDVSAGASHTCVHATNAAYCWGFNNTGQLGNNSTSQSGVAVAVNTAGSLSGKSVTSVATGSNYSCAVASSEVYCWGAAGRLGDGLNTQSLVPSTKVGLNATETLYANYNDFKLRFALKTAASCTDQVTGFTDITTSTAIAWNTNAGVASGTAISSNANDPTLSTDTIYQTYVSGGATFTNAVDITPQKYGLWDFSLKDNSGLQSTSYCLRVVYADNSEIEAYVSNPEIMTAGTGLSLDFVNSSGTPIANPSFAMTTTNLLTSCQLVTGIMGSSGGNRLRITQGSPGNGWNISLAATGGATSTWTRTVAGAFYDYNDSSGSPAGCNSGSDGDGLAGQLSVAANTISLTPQSGCGTTGLSLGGGMTGFVQGTVNAITLLTSTSASQSNCFFDLPGMSVQQRIPSGQAQGSYEIQLTATVVAQ